MISSPEPGADHAHHNERTRYRSAQRGRPYRFNARDLGQPICRRGPRVPDGSPAAGTGTPPGGTRGQPGGCRPVGAGQGRDPGEAAPVSLPLILRPQARREFGDAADWVPITSPDPAPYAIVKEIKAVVQPAGSEFVATFFDANISARGTNEV